MDKMPPRLALAFFRWFCRPDMKEDIEGDLMERFNDRLKISKPAEAKWLFTKDVITLFRPGIIKNINLTESSYMRNINWAQLVLVNAAVALSILLPFLPGPANKFIFILSAIGNFAALPGLLLIPVGCYWVVNALHKTQATSRVPYFIAVGTTTYLFLFWAAIILASFGVYGAITGITGSLIVITGLWQAIKSIKKIKRNPQSKFLPVPLYLISIPLIAFCTRTFVAPAMNDYSRNFAIERGQELVNTIEEFKEKEGRYPESIAEIEEVPVPFIMGIEKFRYTRNRDYYFLTFSQWPDGGITEEIVMFGKKDPAEEYTPVDKYDYNNDYHRVMGAFASYSTGYKNWKYYLCD